MLSIRTNTVGLIAALSIAAAGPATAAPAPQGAPTAQAACKSARILGNPKCIARGQYCTHTSRANRDYHRYGYHCGKRDYRGRYHLRYY